MWTDGWEETHDEANVIFTILANAPHQMTNLHFFTGAVHAFFDVVLGHLILRLV